MVSFGWYGMLRFLEPGETIRLGFRAYNDTDEDLKVHVDVYQKEPVVRYIGSAEFTAHARSTTRYLSLIEFTMPYQSVVLHAEFDATGVKTGKKYSEGHDWLIVVKEQGELPSVGEALMQELKKWYKKNVDVPGVTEPYDWSFDVTSTVIESGLIENVEKAYLYGWYRIDKYAYAGKERPPDRSAQDIVYGWQECKELALLNIGTDVYDIPEEYAGWYWVTVPCRLVVVQKEAPKASIIKDLSKYPDGLGGIIYNGQPLEPNKEHPVPKGSKVEYFAFAQNIGGPGDIWIRLLVNGVEVDRAVGTSPTIYGTITVRRGAEVRSRARGHKGRRVGVLI